MREEGDVVAMSQFQQAPSVIQGQTCEHIQAMLSEVQDLLGRLTSLRMQHLFMIHASPRYDGRQNISMITTELYFRKQCEYITLL